MKRSQEEQAEIDRNRLGKVIWLISIGLILIACFGMNGGSAAGFIGGLGMIGFFVGFFLTMANKSAGELDEIHRNAQIQADQMVRMVQAGMSPGEVSNRITDMNHPKRASDSGTKEIIKGAAIGGIIAGDAGAVIGATVAKNKFDNQKKNN